MTLARTEVMAQPALLSQGINQSKASESAVLFFSSDEFDF